MIATLVLEEKCELVELETIISAGLANFICVGQALMRVRDRRLYRDRFQTFEVYCRERWDLSYCHAHRLTVAAEIAVSLPRGNLIPATEKQVRPLGPLPPEKRPAVWAAAVAETGGAQPRARRVAELAARARASLGAEALEHLVQEEERALARRATARVKIAARATSKEAKCTWRIRQALRLAAGNPALEDLLARALAIADLQWPESPDKTGEARSG